MKAMAYDNKAEALKRYYKHKQKNLDWMKEYNAHKRELVFEILGGAVCANCGNDDSDVLQFDHIDNDGYRLRKDELKTTRYKYWIDHPDIEVKTMQVLCANCNWKKRKMRERNEV